MAERKATNKYYPPEWEPQHGSINTFRNTHPLRERAKKLKSDGILIIRFAMPFNVWCEKCNVLIGSGTRFNAEKTCVGKYLDLDIWQFSMKCASCKNRIVIRTDPESSTYIVTSGGKRRVEDWVPEEGEVHKVMTAEESALIARDPMRQKEVQAMDEAKFGLNSSIHATINQLKRVQDVNWKKDYDNGAFIRKKHREMRKRMDAENKKFDSIYGNTRKDIPLLPSNESDLVAAHQTSFHGLSKRVISSIVDKKKQVSKINKMVNILRKKQKKNDLDIKTDEILKVSPGLPTNELIIPKQTKVQNEPSSNVASSSLLCIAEKYK